MKGFNPVISIPPDIMHDCLEGIVPMVLKMFFVSLGNNVSISFINAKIKEFRFGLSDIKNKPRCLAHNVVKQMEVLL